MRTIDSKPFRTRGVGTSVRCKCGTVVLSLAPSEQIVVATRTPFGISEVRSGDCPSCGSSVRVRVRVTDG